MQAAQGECGQPSLTGEQFLGRRSTMRHQQIAVPAAEGMGVQPAGASAATLDAMSHGEMAGLQKADHVLENDVCL